jgi:hypothetical protein
VLQSLLTQHFIERKVLLMMTAKRAWSLLQESLGLYRVIPKVKDRKNSKNPEKTTAATGDMLGFALKKHSLLLFAHNL